MNRACVIIVLCLATVAAGSGVVAADSSRQITPIGYVDDFRKYPIATTSEWTSELVWINEYIMFDYLSSALTPKAKNDLDDVVAYLKAFPGVKVDICVYMEDREGWFFCVGRNRAVVDYIVGKGISKSRLHVEEHGIRFPCIFYETDSVKIEKIRNDSRIVWIHEPWF